MGTSGSLDKPFKISKLLVWEAYFRLNQRNHDELTGRRRSSRGLGLRNLDTPELANRTKETVMAGMLNRIKNFMRSPKGQEMMNKAREMAKDPRNRERVRQATQGLRRKR